jgi:pantoate kinase
MFSSEYYVPSHITGFFVPFFSDDCFKTGSTGAGVSLSSGLKTRIRIVKGNDSIDIKINGTKTNAPVSLNCINLIKERYPDFFRDTDVLVEHESDVPIESGFGASASAVLGICFSIKDLIKISDEECIRIAHETEVRNLSGLGDVVAEVKGGIEIRKTPGVDGIIENIPTNNLNVLAISLGMKKTESILKNPGKLEIIEKCGTKLLNRLIGEPNVENLMECSKIFTYKTGIMSKEILEIVETISEVNSYNAAGIMIGEGAFTFINEEDKNKVLESLIDINGDIVVSPIARGLL